MVWNFKVMPNVKISHRNPVRYWLFIALHVRVRRLLGVVFVR
jgi:hypothetical protein